jgi:cephalosporin hydroxylase
MVPMDASREALELARQRIASNDFAGAMGLLEELLFVGRFVPEVHHLRAVCFMNTNQPLAALHAAEGELAVNPSHAGAREIVQRVQSQLQAPGSDRPAERPWATALEAKLIQHFELLSNRHTYRGIPMVKNVFDQSIYPLLLWKLKPRTIIEVGSYYGGSAVWMADLFQAWGLPNYIYSIDVRPVTTASHANVTFLTGSGRELGTVLSDEMLAKLPRPWMVIEDADHSYETTTAVLQFFHDRLEHEECIVVEDVLSAPPTAAALRDWLSRHGTDYRVDRESCDFFGQNVTWCVNGFLRRLKATA